MPAARCQSVLLGARHPSRDRTAASLAREQVWAPSPPSLSCPDFGAGSASSCLVLPSASAEGLTPPSVACFPDGFSRFSD